MNKKNLKIIYWFSTILFLLPTAGSGIPELFMNGIEQVVSNLILLGYPLYIMKILGLAKILGSIAIISDKYKTLKEWAYAGFTFDFLGATASHLFIGDIKSSFMPLIILIIMFVSYFSWHKLVDEK